MENKRSGPTFRVSSADVRIIRCLNEDARSSAAAIAEKLQMSESTVRYRLGRLVENKVLEFTAVPNPLHLGYQNWAILEIHAELARIRNIAKELSLRPEVYFVAITTGNYDILAGAVFRSNNEMLEFITDYLPSVPGIVRTSTSTVLDVVKRFLTFAAPEQEAQKAKAKSRKPAIRKAAPSKARSKEK